MYTELNKSESMNMEDPSVDIVVLNWNGWKDTIDCLCSLIKMNYYNCRIIVIDNGSDDNSSKIICDWVKNNHVVLNIVFVDHKSDCISSVIKYNIASPNILDCTLLEENNYDNKLQRDIVFIQARENLGFACGVNIGMRYAIASGVDYIWILNNDTTVESDSLRRLVDFMKVHKEFGGATGQIRYYYEKSRVWNCGGALSFYGSRKYDYANKNVSETPQVGWKQVTFITGCAFLLRTSLLNEHGLLTEKFFFGEEDIELCFRLKRSGRKLVCVYNSIIYHKVSNSTGGLSAKLNIGLIYIYYLNRFINMKSLMPLPIWYTWRVAVLFYIVPMLKIRYNISLQLIKRLVWMLLEKSFARDAVTKEEFMSAINGFNEDEPAKGNEALPD